MKPERERALIEASRRNPFWICVIIFVALAGDYGLRLSNLFQQRRQLEQTQLVQTQNLGALAEAQQLEGRLEALSLELIQVAATNRTAKQIVQDFNIQWAPAAASAAPAGLTVPATKSVC